LGIVRQEEAAERHADVSLLIVSLNCRSRENDLPLIAVPRLLLKYFDEKISSVRGTSRTSSSKSSLKTRNSPKEIENSHIEEIKRLHGLCLLDFSPECVASSIVDLWIDLASEESQQDFLSFHKGWIPHVVLLGCLNSKGSETIERVIEVACCLDLLCQQHILAVAIVHALNKVAVSRLLVWEDVQPALILKMEEILEGSLARDVPSTAIFRAPRDISLEYWVLTRAHVSDELLFQESCSLQPQNQSTDVESRISNLEALLVSLNDISEPGMGDVEVLSDVDNSTDEGSNSSILCLSDDDSDFDDADPVASLASETRERISQRLEELKNSIHKRMGKMSQPPQSLLKTTMTTEKWNGALIYVENGVHLDEN
jgi:hypothetical protein